MINRNQSVVPAPGDARPKNRLLAGLPKSDWRRLTPHLRTIPVSAKYVFYRANDPIYDIYFLNGGVASMTMAMRTGDVVELATVGDEGLLGISALWGAERSAGDAFMQITDTSAEALPIPIFRREIQRRGGLFDACQRYSQAFMLLMMQSIACTATHSVQQRCCRWLLMTHDRTHVDEFRLSHEFLAMMLGASRPTVTVVAGTLQKAGLIKYRHGRITVLNREGLERGACECYQTVRAHFDRLGL